jgi:hypothetical protein
MKKKKKHTIVIFIVRKNIIQIEIYFYPRFELPPFGSSLDFRFVVVVVELDDDDKQCPLMLFC